MLVVSVRCQHAASRLLTAGIGALLFATSAAADQTWPASVKASYRVSVAGFDIGTFDFKSTQTGNAYTLAGRAELSWGFGMFSWTSTTHASGTIAGERVTPTAYTLDYRTESKAGSIKVAFRNDAVSNIAIVPTPTSQVPIVPLQPQHLEAVFDPMSAMLAMTRSAAGEPCARKVAIFDGQQRFDLGLTPHGQEKLAQRDAEGRPVVAHVCHLHYTPVAGHRRPEPGEAPHRAPAIVVSMRHVPSAQLYVPARLELATALGDVEIKLQHIEIIGAGNRQIALSE